MFLQVSDSLHGVVVSQHALQVSRPTQVGQKVEGSPGPYPGGKVGGSGLGGSPGPHLGLGGGVSQHALRQTPPKQTSTAEGGTHPTGMQSCFRCNFRLSVVVLCCSSVILTMK